MKKLLFLSLFTLSSIPLFAMEGKHKEEPEQEKQEAKPKTEFECLKDLLCDSNHKDILPAISEYLEDIFGNKKALCNKLLKDKVVCINNKFFLQKMLFVAFMLKAEAEEKRFLLLNINNLIVEGSIARYKLPKSAIKTETGASRCMPMYEGEKYRQAIQDYSDAKDEINKLNKLSKTDLEVEQVILINKIVSHIKNAAMDGKDIFDNNHEKYALEESEKILFGQLPSSIYKLLSNYVFCNA